jgi:hypothetical protein
MQMTETAGLYEALANAQADIRNPEKTKTAKVKGKTKTGAAYEYEYKYADIADVLSGALPVFSKHGLAILQPTRVENGQLFIETIITHKSGESTSSTYPVCGINNDHQGMGAAMTYARRYALCSMIGVAAEEDTDGQGAAKASGGKPMSVHAAKKEVNWDGIVKAIREAKTEKLLENMATRVTDNEGIWPDSYVTNAREEIEARRKDLTTPTTNGAGPEFAQWDNYDEKLEGLVAVLSEATPEIQAEIWEAEQIEERYSAGMIFPPDKDKLTALLKAA